MPQSIIDVADLLKDGDSEPLHPDLSVVFRAKGVPMISHPLVHEAHYMPMMNKLINYGYDKKKHLLQEYLEAKDWNSLLFLIERPHRFQAFKEHMNHMSDEEYWQNLADVYCDSENINQIPDVDKLLLSTRPHRKCMMSDSGATTLEEMPDKITIYRGFSRDRYWTHSFSFTTSRKVAAWFARRDGFPAPTLLTATVNKSDVLAYLDQRDECEILTNPDNITVKSTKRIAPDLRHGVSSEAAVYQAINRL